MDFVLDNLDGVRGLHVDGDGLAIQGRDEDLHFIVYPDLLGEHLHDVVHWVSAGPLHTGCGDQPARHTTRVR